MIIVITYLTTVYSSFIKPASYIFLCCYAVDVQVDVSFQVTTISVIEDVFLVNFTFDITGLVDPNSTTTVSLTAIDDTASKYIAAALDNLVAN